jgi:hypothetical protein
MLRVLRFDTGSASPFSKWGGEAGGMHTNGQDRCHRTRWRKWLDLRGPASAALFANGGTVAPHGAIAA